MLGKGFLMIDLIRYTAGMVIAYVLDQMLVKDRKEENDGM